jgi:hypothetical protein
MDKSQAVSELSIALTRVTTPDNALALIQRALRITGLSNATTLNNTDMSALLQALASEGGAIQELAQLIAINGVDDGPKAA